MRTPRRSRRSTARSLVLALVALPLAVVALPSPAQADGPGAGSPWVVSVGDSYISGEAGRWAGTISWLDAEPRAADASTVALWSSQPGVKADIDVWRMGCGWVDPSWTDKPSL